MNIVAGGYVSHGSRRKACFNVAKGYVFYSSTATFSVRAVHGGCQQRRLTSSMAVTVLRKASCFSSGSLTTISRLALLQLSMQHSSPDSPYQLTASVVVLYFDLRYASTRARATYSSGILGLFAPPPKMIQGGGSGSSTQRGRGRFGATHCVDPMNTGGPPWTETVDGSRL